VTAAGFATTGVFDLKSLIPFYHMMLIVKVTSKMKILIERGKVGMSNSHVAKRISYDTGKRK
jgi:hypothetical protein